jgi:hypothetical protein
MKIKIKNKLLVELNSLVRIEFKHLIPSLIIHERFEKYIKWVIRILTVIGIAVSVITIPVWYYSLTLAIAIFGVGQFFERAVFEYSTMVVLPLPDFAIDYSQWKTNGFMLPHVLSDENRCYMGPSFQDRGYAIKFFNYLKQWNWDRDIDDENIIVVSIVMEPDSKYTTYIYSNPGRKSLDEVFSSEAEKNKLSKYGKKQQKLFTQMIFCKTLEYREDFYIHQFLSMQAPAGQFYFVPSVVPQHAGDKVEFLFDHGMVKYQYKLRNRSDISKFDVENYLKPDPA